MLGRILQAPILSTRDQIISLHDSQRLFQPRIQTALNRLGQVSWAPLASPGAAGAAAVSCLGRHSVRKGPTGWTLVPTYSWNSA